MDKTTGSADPQATSGTAPARQSIASEVRLADSTTLQAVIDAVPALVNAKDRESRYLFMNRYQADLYGVTPAQAVGHTAAQIVGQAYGTYTRSLDERVLDGGEALAFFEEDFQTRAGERLVLLTTKAPLKSERGDVVAVVTVSLDISPRKRAEAALAESEAQAIDARAILSEAIESMNDGFVLFDCDDRFVMCNERYRKLYREVADLLVPGTTLDEINAAYAQRAVTLYPDSEQRERFVRARHQAWKSGYSMTEPTPDGRWIETRDQASHGGYWVGIRIDVTERLKAEQALVHSEQRYRSLFDAAPIALWEEDWSGVKRLVDAWQASDDGDVGELLGDNPDLLRRATAAVRVLEVNEAARKLFAAPSKDALVRGHNERLTQSPCESFLDQVSHLARGHYRVVTECEDRRFDHSIFYQRINLEVPAPYRDDWRRVYTAVEDITETRALSERLEYQATHDALTGLANRTEFELRLTRALHGAGEAQDQHALCYLDLDQFKLINDTCGHAAGDELLRRLAHLMMLRLRGRDTLARLGGDEFGVLLEHCSVDKATRVAHELKDMVERFRFEWAGQVFSIGVSMGLVPLVGDGQTMGEVLSAADAACYAAKEQGRNRIHVYHEDDADVAMRHGEMRWVARIERALDEDRFELARQDIVPMADTPDPGTHFELLLRMRDEHGDLVLPGAFLPAAERYNLAPRLDRWVVSRAVKTLSRDPELTGALALCSINLSGLTLADEGFLDFVETALAHHAPLARKICFEITETAAIANLAGATRLMEALRALGCRFALDDFGSGLSSFAYLKRLPVDFLKIDGVFVKDIADSPIDRAMVKSINEIGHAIGIQTIAEFVENERILAVVRDIGVDFAQGYALGRPRPF